MKNEKAFMLLELMVSLAILATALLAICQSFITSLGAGNYSRKYSIACMLAEEKLAELEETLEVPDGEITGNFNEPYSHFSWKIQTEQSSNESLEQVRVTVFWVERGKEKQLKLSALLFKNPEI